MLLKNNNVDEYKIIKVIEQTADSVLVIDCIKRNMPVWFEKSILNSYYEIDYQELISETKADFLPLDKLEPDALAVVHKRFSLISPILSVVSDKSERTAWIAQISKDKNYSKQTIRHYLCLYLVYEDKAALAPKNKPEARPLTDDEKKMRRALNKYYYSLKRYSLPQTYKHMLIDSYCDEDGLLKENFPTFIQFRYYYRKNKNLENMYITRNGLQNYQRNSRPLLGDGIQSYANHIGIGMIDSTICDIYLVDESGRVCGRPTLVACIDAFSRLCNGFALVFEGGLYSLRTLLVNIASDKVAYCKKLGIAIDRKDWDSDKLPGTFVTDQGSEYCSDTFAQITELGVTIENLPPYRPDLKGAVEKFFDIIQGMFKPVLKGKGVVEPDANSRGAHDYRKDACLTIKDFERIIARCIVFYNKAYTIKKFPYDQQMIEDDIQPFASSIWEWGKNQPSANLIEAEPEQIIKTLLPRTVGRFKRNGLIVNKMRYKNNDYTEKYLSGGDVIAAYDPDLNDRVWLIENGRFIEFTLIESVYKDSSLEQAMELRSRKKDMISSNEVKSMQESIDLTNFITTIAALRRPVEKTRVDNIRSTNKRARADKHIEYAYEYIGKKGDDE